MARPERIEGLDLIRYALERNRGQDHHQTRTARTALVEMYIGWGKPEDGARLARR